MDGYWGLEVSEHPYYTDDVITAEEMSQTNGVPFYRKQSDEQVNETLRWVEGGFPGAFPKKFLGVLYPADFDSDGKLRTAREAWSIDDGIKRRNPPPPFATMEYWEGGSDDIQNSKGPQRDSKEPPRLNQYLLDLISDDEA
ncbi:hypothetical protein FQN55_009287 [Onygenales sp. PD_40]|nr:hypothetical protein FQN55_009287 [Onygenales sp. PD_40]